jgi:hypothetical protein
MLSPDPHKAPDHLVTLIAAAYPTRRSPVGTREDHHRAHLAQARVLANRIWQEAYTAGAVRASSMAAGRWMLVVEGQPDQPVPAGDVFVPWPSPPGTPVRFVERPPAPEPE